jgi:hypothetical protein
LRLATVAGRSRPIAVDIVMLVGYWAKDFAATTGDRRSRGAGGVPAAPDWCPRSQVRIPGLQWRGCLGASGFVVHASAPRPIAVDHGAPFVSTPPWAAPTNAAAHIGGVT